MRHDIFQGITLKIRSGDCFFWLMVTPCMWLDCITPVINFILNNFYFVRFSTIMQFFSINHCGILDRFCCPQIGPPPPVICLESKSVDDAWESVEAHHENEEVGVVLGLHTRALRAACLWDGKWQWIKRGSCTYRIYESLLLYKSIQKDLINVHS